MFLKFTLTAIGCPGTRRGWSKTSDVTFNFLGVSITLGNNELACRPPTHRNDSGNPTPTQIHTRTPAVMRHQIGSWVLSSHTMQVPPRTTAERQKQIRATRYSGGLRPTMLTPTPTKRAATTPTMPHAISMPVILSLSTGCRRPNYFLGQKKGESRR